MIWLVLYLFLLFKGNYAKNSNAYDNLIQWMQSNGGYINDKLVPIEKIPTNRYIITKEKIKQNEEILFIPNEISISIVNKKISQICRKIFGYAEGNDFNCVVYYMLIDKYSKKSFFATYYKYLPKIDKDTTPLYFNSFLLTYYKVTEIDKEISTAKRYLESSYEDIRPNLPLMITFDDFKETFQIVISRNFGCRESIFPEIDSMMPYLDLFNHVNDNNTYYYYDDRRDGFVLYAIRDISKNEEVTVSYGSHHNLYLFTAYGFTLKNNKFKSSLTLYLKDQRFTLNGYVKEEDIF